MIFKSDIKNIAINKREKQIISLVEEKFDKFIRLLKEEENAEVHRLHRRIDDSKLFSMNQTKWLHKALGFLLVNIIKRSDKLTGDLK